MIMLTRSFERIFNPMRYTGDKFVQKTIKLIKTIKLTKMKMKHSLLKQIVLQILFYTKIQFFMLSIYIYIDQVMHTLNNLWRSIAKVHFFHWNIIGK